MFTKAKSVFFFCCLCCLVLASPLCPAASVYSVHYDNSGTGTNSAESLLTPSNVITGKFGLSCTINVDGGVFAQPLFAPSVTVSGKQHDLVIVVSMHDTIYAVDAATCASVWSTSVGTSWVNYPVKGIEQFAPISELGCMSTPVIDPQNNILYVSCATSTPTWTLFKLNLITGSVLSSVAISGQVVGTGDTNPSGHTNCGYLGHGDSTSGANLLFAANSELQRPGLRLNNGIVYVEFGGIGDSCPYHGWIIAYNSSSLSQVGIWCTTPNGWGGGVWGGEAIIDSTGNVYITTGNGTDQNAGTSTYTDSVIKLNSTLSKLGSWTPSNNVTINAADADTASDRLILIPGTNLLAATGAKDFNVYVLDANCLSGGSGTSCQTQTFQTCSSCVLGDDTGSYGSAFINNSLVLPITQGDIYSFVWGGSTFTTTPTWHQANTYGFPGPATMGGSCNGSSNCILWAVTAATSAVSSNVPGTLRAINAATGSELWNSGTTTGNISKFSEPTVANGKVILASQSNQVFVFGLTPSSGISGLSTISGLATIQ